MVPPVSPPRDPMAHPVSPSWDTVSCAASSESGGVCRVSSFASSEASCVLSSGFGGPSYVSCSSSLMPGAASAQALVRWAAKPLFFRLVHGHPALRRRPHYEHHRCRSCQARQSTAWPAVLLPPASAPLKASTGPLSLFSSPQQFWLPTPAPPLDSTSVSHLLRKTIPCGEWFNDWEGRGCHKFVPVSGGDGTKTLPTGDLFDQPPGERS